jgi:hypothetical protein
MEGQDLLACSSGVQWGSEYQTPEYWKHLISEWIFSVPVFEWLDHYISSNGYNHLNS